MLASVNAVKVYFRGICLIAPYSLTTRKDTFRARRGKSGAHADTGEDFGPSWDAPALQQSSQNYNESPN